MDIFTILSALRNYGLWALAAAGGLAVLYAAAFWVYKNVLHGSKTLSKMQWCALLLLSGWFAAVLGITTFSRGANYAGQVNLSLFSGYVSAWNQWSRTELQLILLNMLMFSPLGFLLPLLTKRGEKFSWACGVSLAVTFLIETVQLATGRGIFELDDLLHNFLGSVFGYLVMMCLLGCIRERRLQWRAAAGAAVIPIAYVLLLSAAMLVYHGRTYGNLPFVPAEKQDMSVVSVEKQAELSDETAVVSVYRNRYANDPARGGQLSEELAAFLGITFGSTPRMAESRKIFVSDTGGAQLTYFTRDATWSYTSWREGAVCSGDLLERGQASLEDWLERTELLPPGAVFSVQNGTTLRWDMEADGREQGRSGYTGGMILAELDEAGEVVSLSDYMVCHEFVEQVEILSPQEAYGQVLSGNFAQYTPFEKGDTLYVNGCRLEYAPDTKGYDRPVYRFDGYINTADRGWSAVVSAMR